MNEAIFTQLQKEMDGSVGSLRKELDQAAHWPGFDVVARSRRSWTITARQHRSINWRP